MPVDEAGLHQPALALPPGLLATEEVWTIRFTGEVFRDYECAFHVRYGYGGSDSVMQSEHLRQL